MTTGDENLRALWLARTTTDSSPKLDESTLAQWLDGTLDDTLAERVEAMLAESRDARDLVLGARRTGAAEAPDIELQKRLRLLVEEAFKPASQPGVLWRFSLQAAAAAAAIAISALGFTFGRAAAPATSQATSDFASIVTFDVLSDQEQFDSVLSITGLTITPDSTRKGESP